MKSLSVLLLVCASSAVLAQGPAIDGEHVYAESRGRDRAGKRAGLPPLVWKPWVTEYQPTESEKKLLASTAEDEQRFAEVLQRPDTGLIHLYPAQRRSRVVSIDDLLAGKTPGFNNYACMFSFSRRKYGQSLNGWVDPRLGWAELRLQRHAVVAGFNGESVALLVGLGDVAIESVTPETPGIAEIDRLVPPIDDVEADEAKTISFEGFEKNGFRYRALLPAVLNMTYGLRSISNRRADVLVVFRIVRQFQDGSLTILWKKLKRYPKPSWKRSE